MGRKKTIDRDALLDAAEKIVSSHGAAALTIDSVARAAGITKGGVQYSFPSKDALIEAMFARWDKEYDDEFRAIAGDTPDPVTAVFAHAEATGAASEAAGARSAGLMAAIIRTPEHLGPVRRWYAARVAGLDASTPQGRRARLAFLATEGAFALRYFGFHEIGAAEWRDIFRDIDALRDGAPGDER